MNSTITTRAASVGPKSAQTRTDGLTATFFWLAAFYIVYCARPEDWIPGLKYLPLAKITASCALIGLLTSFKKTQRSFRDLPKESRYLFLLSALLFAGGFMSPVWRGGAVSHAIDFSKVYVAWVLTFLVITTVGKLRKIIYIQAVSVVIICIVSILKGYDRPRLDGVIGGIYSNPNDLAFAIVLAIPFCLAFLVSSKGIVVKLGWTVGILVMLSALFLTASRGGFIDLVIAGTVCLWHFGVKGKRFYLILATVFIGGIIMITAGGKLKARFEALSGDSATDQNAYGSYEQRKYLMERALTGIAHYPVFGVGANNFLTYSLVWHEVHMTYLQIAVEGGIPALILFLLFFGRGFRNLQLLLRMRELDPDIKLFVWALLSSLVGFVVGALFAPEAYQFFPYFAVAYTSTLLAIVKSEKNAGSVTPKLRYSPSWRDLKLRDPKTYDRSRVDAFTNNR